MSAAPSEPSLPHDRVNALIVATNWWPISARLAMRLLAHGCEVVALCPRGHVLCQLTGIRSVRTYSGLNSLAALESAIRSSPTIVIPCDDRAVWQLHELHRQLPDVRDLVARSLGDSAHFDTIRSRAQLLKVAARSGIRVPETRRIATPNDITDWFSKVPGTSVLKMDGTWGGRGVSVVRTEGEALSAWRKFTSSQKRGSRWMRRWKDWLVYCDPLAFWDDPAFDRREVLLQRYVVGRLANSMLACWRGKLLGMVNVEVLCTEATATAASTIVRLIDHPEMTRAGEMLCTTLGLSGFHGLDFILEEGSNCAQLIELNARCTRLGHLRLPRQDDLAASLVRHIGAMPPDTDVEAIVSHKIVAFFPQVLSWNPDSPYLRECYVDVPWSEPQLIAALLGRPWVYARPLFRLFHDGLRKQKDPPPSIPQFLRIAAETGHSGEFGPDLNLQRN